MKRLTLALFAVLSLPGLVLAAADETRLLQEQLAEQRAMIRQQMQMLQAQQTTIEGLSRRVADLEGGSILLEQPVTAATAAPADSLRTGAETASIDASL